MKKAGHISNNAGCRTDTQRWLSGGKELLTEFGVNEYDQMFRRLVPLTGRFTQPDPFGFLTPETSPYAYCAADPVNHIDPTGLNPVYDNDGVFLGTTKEGFCGLVYIYNGDYLPDLYNYYMDELLASKNSFLYSRMDGCGLSTTAKTAIFNHILSQYEGANINGYIFSMSLLDGNGVHYNDRLSNANWMTKFNKSGTTKPRISYGKYMAGDYESTVENIICSVLLHEWITHGIMHYNDDDRTHWKSYEYVICDILFFPFTTNRYKSFYTANMVKYVLGIYP